MDSEELKEKLREFMTNKLGLDLTGCYFLTKEANEDIWEELKYSDEEEGDSESDELDFGDEDVDMEEDTTDNSDNENQEDQEEEDGVKEQIPEEHKEKTDQRSG